MWVQSLRIKLGIFNALLITVAFGCVGYLRYAVTTYRVQQSFDQRLQQDAAALAVHIKPDPARGFVWDWSGLPRRDFFRIERLRTYSVVATFAGAILRADSCSEQMLALLSDEALTADLLRQRNGFITIEAAGGSQYRFVNLPIVAAGGSPEMSVHVGRSTETLRSLLDEYASMYSYSLPLIVVVAAIAGWFLAGRALKPFDELAHAAGEISSSSLNRQVTSTHTEVEVQRLAAAFNDMVVRLNRSFEQLRRFNADAAHELRTPLTILRGNTETVLESPSLTEDERELLTSSLEELDRLAALISQMLLLSEAEAGRQVLVKKPFGIKPVLADLAEQIQPMAADQGVEIAVLDLSDAVIYGDELWVRRALINILDNAIKYSKQNGRIEISSSVANGAARIRIRDYGIGIDANDLPHVFDRLYRADPARSRASGGLGLGLSLVKWVVESHDGNVRLSSELNCGTLCEIEFPVMAEPASGAAPMK